MPRVRKPHPVLDRTIVIFVILLATIAVLSGCKEAAPKRDPRCDGAGRYDFMRSSDLSGQGAGHACQ
jgi:hypothetical protein